MYAKWFHLVRSFVFLSMALVLFSGNLFAQVEKVELNITGYLCGF